MYLAKKEHLKDVLFFKITGSQQMLSKDFSKAQLFCSIGWMPIMYNISGW